MRRSIGPFAWHRFALVLLAWTLWACGGQRDQDQQAGTQPVPEAEETAPPAAPPQQTAPAEQTAPPSESVSPQRPAPASKGKPAARRSAAPPAVETPAVKAPPIAPERAPAPSSPAAPLPAPSASSPAPPPPEIIEVTLPAGTILETELLSPLDTSVSRVGDEIQARTIAPVYVKGEPVLPRGTYLEGRVTEVQASGRVKGRARLAFTFDRLSTRTGVKVIQTSYIDKEAASGKKKDATIVGGGAGLGALVGGIIGGKKGAAIGAAIGGAGGTGVVLTTKGEEIKLPVGTEVNVRLDAPVVIQIN